MAAKPLEGPALPPSPALKSADLSKGMTASMSLAVALAVANNYYCLPLMGLISRDLPGSLTAYVPTAAQLGYTLGLFLLIPLGDMMERRSLAVGQFLLLAAGLALIAMSWSGPMLIAASLLVGLASTAAQQIIPLAANLASPERRGAVIGIIASGAMTGTLLSRVVAGFVGGAYGWRAIYWGSVPLALFAAALMAWMLPRSRTAPGMSYGGLMASLVPLWRAYPELRLAAMTEALIFASYTAFWSTMALHLQEPAIGLGPEAAGSFGLIGIAGIVAAPIIGRFADRKGAYPAIIGGTILTAVGWAIMGLWGTVAGLLVGVIMLDGAARSVLIACQTRVYAQDRAAQSRLSTIFMGAMFLGGAMGSALAVSVYRQGGWGWLAIFAAGLALTAAAIQIVHHQRRSKAAG